MDQVKLLVADKQSASQVSRSLLKYLVSELYLQGKALSAHWVAVPAEDYVYSIALVYSYTHIPSLPPSSSLLLPEASLQQCCARLPFPDDVNQVYRSKHLLPRSSACNWLSLNYKGLWEKPSARPCCTFTSWRLRVYSLCWDQVTHTRTLPWSPALWKPCSTHWQWRVVCGSSVQVKGALSGNGAQVAYPL